MRIFFPLLFFGICILSTSFIIHIYSNEECPPGECEDNPAVSRRGGPPLVPSIGTCQKHSVTKAWQCVARYPIEFGPFWKEYDTCRKTPPFDKKICLLKWVNLMDITPCGFVIPGTGNSNIPGSGDIEVPYQPSTNNDLSKEETLYQCTGEIPSYRWSPLIRGLRR